MIAMEIYFSRIPSVELEAELLRRKIERVTREIDRLTSQANAMSKGNERRKSMLAAMLARSPMRAAEQKEAL